MIIYVIFSLPKTIVFNLMALPIKQSLKLPFFIGYNVKIENIHKGIVRLPNKISMFMIRFGAGGSKGLSKERQSKIMLSRGSVTFEGKARFAEGNILTVSGDLIFGEGFSSNKNCFISCQNKMTIGKNVLLGWNVNIIDNNGGNHTVLVDNMKKSSFGSVFIGDHVWLCSYSSVMKNTQISNDSILAWGSILTKKISDSNCLLAGSPAEIKQKDIEWQI